MGYFHRVNKRDFSEKQRGKAADSGAALPDGSFPIYNGRDLANAVNLVGRASDPEKAKAHIISRAKDLGLESSLPADWTGGNADAKKSEPGDVLGMRGIFNTKDKPVGESSHQYDFASLGKLLTRSFPSESLAGVMKEDKEKMAVLLRKAYVDGPNSNGGAGDAAAPQPGAGATSDTGTTKPAPKVTWAKRSQMAMSAKNKNTGRPIDAILPFMQGKFGMNLFQSTGVSADDIPVILQAFKQGGFTMAQPTADEDKEGPDCYSFMSRDGTHVYMEVEPDQGSIAWVIETPDKQIQVNGPPNVGDTRQVQSRFAEQQKRRAAQAQAAQANDMGAQPPPGAGDMQPMQKSTKKWDKLKPLF